MAEDNKKSFDVLIQEMKKVNQNLTWASEISSNRLDTVARLQTSGINSIRAMYDDSKKTQVDLAKKVEENTEAIKNSNDTSAEDRVEEKRDKKGFLDSMKKMFAKTAKGGGNLFGGIGKTVKKVFSLIKGKFLMIGALVLGAISQMNMEDLEDIWKAFKETWQGIKKFMTPIIDWFKETVFPETIKLLKKSLEGLGELFNNLAKDFEGFTTADWWGEDGKFHKLIKALGSVGTWAFKQAGAIGEWALKILGVDGEFIQGFKDKWNGIFGPDAPDGILKTLGTALKSIAGMFILGKIIGGTTGTLLTAPLKLAIMGAKGAGGLIGSLAKSIGSAMIGPGGAGTASVGKLLMGAAKGVGILGLAVAVGKGIYEGYEAVKGGASIREGFDVGLASFFDVLTLGLLPDGMAMSWAKNINGFFGSIYDAMFGDKQKELSVKEIKETREMKSGKKYAQMSQDERNAEQAKLIKKQNERRAKGDVGGAGEYIAPQKTTDEKIEKAKRKLRNLQSQLERNSKGKQSAASVKDKLRIINEIKTQKGVLDFESKDKGRTFSEAEQIQKDEGFRPGAYKDTEGIDTIGYGFNLERKGAQKLLDGKGIKKSVADLRSGKVKLTKEEASILMLGEMGHFRSVAENYIGSDVWKKLSPNRKGILTNMAYNMGSGGLGEFQLLRQAIRDGDWEEAQKQMKSSKWAGQVKGRANRLTARMGGDQKTAALNATQTGFTSAQGGPAGTPVMIVDSSTKVNQVAAKTENIVTGNAQPVGVEGGKTLANR